ncbi:hypothetical protein J3A83DRAFT_183902 [Scleroderma citrinum]
MEVYNSNTIADGVPLSFCHRKQVIPSFQVEMRIITCMLLAFAVMARSLPLLCGELGVFGDAVKAKGGSIHNALSVDKRQLPPLPVAAPLLCLTSLLTSLELPTLTLPTMVLPTLTPPTIGLPTLTLPTIVLPTLTPPTIGFPTLTLPTIGLPTLSMQAVDLPLPTGFLFPVTGEELPSLAAIPTDEVLPSRIGVISVVQVPPAPTSVPGVGDSVLA